MPTSNARIRRYIGIDASLRGTGIALLQLYGNEITRKTLRIAIERIRGPELLHLQCNAFLDFICKHTDESMSRVFGICIEAPSIGSVNRADDMGQIRGAYNLCCMQNFWPWAMPTEIPPNSLKKFFTGNGSASKDSMVYAAKEVGWEVDTHDEADAAGLAELAWALHDDSCTLTRKQLEAIKGIREMNQSTVSKPTNQKILNI